MSLTFHRVLGSGATGQVWEATTDDGLRVAAKTLWPGMAGPRTLRLVENELRAVSRLEHPHVVRVLGRGTVGPDQPVPEGTDWFALEYCGGGTLAERLPDSFAAACEVAVALLDALAHAHARGVLHRDLKPANVLLAVPGDLRPGWKLADFGVAQAMGAGQTRRLVTGSPAYMAPEQHTGATVDQGPWTDLHALGVLVHELVTGAYPSDAALDEPTTRFAVPGALWPWLARLRRRERERRPQSAAEAWRELHDLAPAHVPPPPSGWRAPRRDPARRRVGGAAQVGLLALPFLAREAEREALWAWLHGAGPPVASVTGPSGIGKSALARWLAERAHETGAARVVVLDDLARPPDDLARLLLAVSGQADASPDERGRRIASTWAGADPDDAETVADLVAEPDDRWGSVPAVRAVLARWISGRTLLVLDHPGPGLERLARSLAARPLAGLRLLAAGVAVGQALPLGPLPLAAIEDLGRAAAELDSDAASALGSLAEGHPGYALATVASWVREGGLVRGPYGLGLGRRPTTGAARVDVVRDLEEEGLVALERAAVLGTLVDEGLWEDACDAPGGPGADPVFAPMRVRARLAALGALLDRGDCAETDDGFRFVYPAVRDALVASAERAGRLRSHHAAIAAHLVPRWVVAGGPLDPDGELVPPARPDPRLGPPALRLGLHLLGAGRPREALAPLGHALNWYATRSPERLQEAIALSREALAASGLPDGHPATVRTDIGQAALDLGRGRLQEAFAVAVRAVHAADATGLPHLRAYAHARLVDAASLTDRHPEAAASFAALRQLGDVVPLRWRIPFAAREGRMREILGDPAGAAALREEALALARGGPRELRVGAAWCEAASSADRPEELLEVAAWVLPAAIAEGEIGMAAFVASKRVEALSGLRRVDEAVAAAEEARRLARESGAHRTDVLVLAQLAQLFVREGRPEAAAAAAEEGLALADEASLYATHLRCSAIRAWLRLGDAARVAVEVDRVAAAAPTLPRAALPMLEELAAELPGTPAGERLRALLRSATG